MATLNTGLLHIVTRHFNPHHPRGWRQYGRVSGFDLIYFNPHHPRGWRLYFPIELTIDMVFQSTPPSRVATLYAGFCWTCPAFQSTPPSRVATENSLYGLLLHLISIHTTLAGGDKSSLEDISNEFISIHTTLAGGDVPNSTTGSITSDFNPHHPRGWRPVQYHILPGHFPFQSTPPSRVATFFLSLSGGLYAAISIHTTLAGGDPLGKYGLLIVIRISIHTTLAGGDKCL